MKAYLGQPGAGLDGLSIDERPEPIPAPRQVLIKVRAVSLNNRDILILKGLYPGVTRPVVPVADGTGEVVALGEGVTRVKVGDRVLGTFFQRWIDGPASIGKRDLALVGTCDGLLAEYALLDDEGLVLAPDHLSDEEASCLPCTGVTAWRGLTSGAGFLPGETVLVQGTGNVSLFAAQFAKAAGGRIIITSSSDQKLEKARALGADAGINYQTVPDWDIRVLQLTGGVGVDRVIEVGGAGTLARSINAVRDEGQVSLIGVLAGWAHEVSVAPLIAKHVRIHGFTVGSRAAFENMNRAITVSQVRPVIDRTFTFSEARSALGYLESGRQFGKVVIRVS
ncbi:MAG TPA: NAD(P)-dependent alcohol dehydrogenase [Dehalococcoidia bacterium]|nr:NAD(P)-dependent alcohol dehydrogenase [Dehalococcoidia bacterium]